MFQVWLHQPRYIWQFMHLICFIFFLKGELATISWSLCSGSSEMTGIKYQYRDSAGRITILSLKKVFYRKRHERFHSSFLHSRTQFIPPLSKRMSRSWNEGADSLIVTCNQIIQVPLAHLTSQDRLFLTLALETETSLGKCRRWTQRTLGWCCVS